MLKRSRTDKKGDEWRPGEGLLLVCDDPDAGELLERLLTRDGHDVYRVETAEGAVRHLLATPRRVAVLSLSGPTANRALVTKVREHPQAGVSRVALVVLDDDLANESAMWADGADGFLARPFHADQLVAEVRAAADRPEADRQAHRDAQGG